MTDLLTSLVDRTLLSVPVLQRRQPSPFEPVAEAAFDPRSQVASGASLEEENNFVAGDPATGPQASEFKPRNHSRRPSLAPKETLASDVEPQHIQPHHQRRLLPPLGEERENDQREFQHEPPKSELTRKQVVQEESSNASSVRDDQAKPENAPFFSSRSIETIIEKRVEREVVSERAPEIQTKEEAASANSPSVALRKPSHAGIAGAKQPLTVKTKLLSPKSADPTIKSLEKKPLPLREVSPQVRATSRNESARAVKQSAPPTIQVTIGRVEVRATTQAPSQPKAAPTVGPRMSLEDYLRSRGEETK